MSDEGYSKKLENLQQYIPFLDNMIQQLKDPTKKNREQQLTKMQSLHAMITDKKKKLKLETLVRCEDVISKLYEKVHNRPIGAAKKSDSPALTPLSPSPPRDVTTSRPLTIPTERLDENRHIQKIDVYSSAAESLNRPRSHGGLTLSGRVPDMSKPPISLEDLKTLEDDVQDKINESALKSASLNELNSLREMLSEQIELEDIKTSPQKTKKEGTAVNINTTVRNNLNLTKKTIQPPDKPSVKSKILLLPTAGSTSKPKDSKPETSPDINKEIKTTSTQLNVKPKILKEPASIFGSILSNIDGQILGGKKRRSSLPGKEERRLSDGAKEKTKTVEKAVDNKKKEEKSSEEKKGDTKKRPEKSKKSNIDPKGTDAALCLTGKKTFLEMEQKLKDKLDKFLEDAKHASSDSTSNTNTEGKDATKDKIVTSKISVKKDIELKATKEAVATVENSKTHTFKRLADKYNPKPKKQSLDADVDKAVTDSIEENMKISPPKIPVINQMAEPVPPPNSLLICSQAEPEHLQSQPSAAPLPAVLQNILNPSTTHLINTVVSHLRQTNAENEARKSPLLPTPPLSMLGNPPATPMMMNSPSMSSNPGLLSPPTREDNFISEYCREVFNNEDNNINNQMQQNQFVPPRPESRLRFEPPSAQQEMMGNQFGQSPRYIPPLIGDRFNEGFASNRQFPGHAPMPDMYGGQTFGFAPNQIDLQPLDYYPPNAPLPANQYNSGPPLLSPEIPHYHNEQKPQGFPMMMNNDFFCQNEDGGHWRNEDTTRYHWSRDQDMRMNSRDPRTYREYREMRDARDPRVVREIPRDPRVNRDPRDSRLQGDRDYRDPRLSKPRDRDNDRDKSGRQRDNRTQSRDYRPSRYDSKFDRIYSRTNRDRSRSRSRSRPKETFASPLDSLYTGKEEHRTGKGYGVQNFRIPKIKKEDEAKEKEEENAKVTSTNEDLLEAIDSDTAIDDAGDSDNEDETKEQNTEAAESAIKEDTEKIKTVKDAKEMEPETLAPQESREPAAEVAAKELEPPKLTNQLSEPEAKPADQTILAQFFANLLGSKNKRDKKTALYSLISTFSDSFNEKELSKITKIIKANDEDESSDEEEETKKAPPKVEDEKESTKEVEDVEKEDDVVKTTKPKARKRIRRISSESPTKEDKSKAAQSVEQELEVKEEEKVIVSVGERIKSRKRNTASPSKPKKKCRTELDWLHEDIQDMFIRDGVLTASGKRMCRILKSDPTVLSAAQQPKDTAPEEAAAKTRKKPGPKSKPKGPNAAEVKVMKSVRVVIPKIPDGDTVQKDENPKRNLRRSVRNVAYAESDDEIASRDDTPPVDVESIAESESLKELESDVESSDSEKEKSAHTAESNPKSKIGKRKRGKAWASGVIPSNKKKKKSKALDETEDTANKKDADVSLTTDSDLDKSYIEPDKNYYTDTLTNKSHQCKLCSYHGRFITTHYKTNHPLSEILTSRFSPAIALEAIKDSDENLLLYESLIRIKGGAKIQFTCRFCEFNTHVPPTMFYDHITTHTGEYRHICPICEFSASSGKTLKSHMSSTHQNEDKRVARKSYGQTIMFGYMCGECNYVQLSKKNVEEHINIFHLQKPTIYKINMSTYMDPEIEKIAEEELPVTESDDLTTHVEDKEEEEIPPKAVEVKKMPPPQRKKPGPKPGPKSAKKKRTEKAQRKKLTEIDSDSVTDNESVTSKESEPIDAQMEKDAVPEETVPKKPFKEITEGEEVYPVVGRSRRAAKDKATEKLKTMMEFTDSSPRKRSISGEEVKKHEEKTKKDEAQTKAKTKPIEETVAKPRIEEKPVEEQIKSQESKGEKVEPETVALEHKVENVETVVKKEVELNVFTCKTDLQEENKKIEQERLQLMDELNKSVGSRTSLNFVDKLCDRLNQSNVVVKQEPKDDLTDSFFSARQLNNDSPLIMPVLQKENHLPPPISSITPSPSTVTVSSNKKPVLEPEVTQVSKPTFDVIQKNDKIITDMIQKLKGKLASGIDDRIARVTVDDTDYESEGPPPLTHVNELVNVKPADGSTKTLLIGGFVRVIKNSDKIMFSCLVPPCVFSTENKDAFQEHCKEAHRQSLLNRPSTLCEMCGMEIVPSAECTLLENLFKHIIADHADFLSSEPEVAFKPPNRVLRIRKLSGDALSVIKSDWDDDSGDSRDTADDDVEASAAKADMEEIDKEKGSVVVSNEATVADDPPPTMVELSMSEDNPFPFKISGVMSLAEPQPPPLAPIAKPPLQLSSGTQLIVKEAKLTQAEVNKPRKTAKAMAKFISSISDLYKCPHYYCLFSTNFRDFLERHLKAHKVEQDIMIPCVYCDMKTPWEHVPMHIDIRHAHCRFACSYCLYRAVVKEYVFLHQDQAHPAADYSVIVLPQPKHSKRFAIAEVKIDPKTLCEPYKCAHPCNSKYLFENEFKRHLQKFHKSNFIPCGYKNCTNKVQAAKMPDHWALRHGVCVYQCGHCKNGASDLIKMYHHFAQCHQGLQPDILIRMVTVLQEGVNLGYTMEAFQVLRKVVTVPNNLLDQNKLDVTLADTPMSLLLSSAKQYGKAGPHKPAKATLQKVASSVPTQSVQNSVLLPGNASALNRSIAFVSSSSSTATTNNILLLPSVSRGNTLSTIVMATQSPIVTAMVPVNKSMRAVPSSEATPPAPRTEGVTITSVLEGKDAAENETENRDGDLTIEPLEHITVCDDNQLAVDEADNVDIDPLSLDMDMSDATKATDGNSSGDDSDGGKTDKSKKASKKGLMSYQLYRCAFCDISFSNSNDFRRHATISMTCRNDDATGKQFVCVHCGRKVKNPQVLLDHIQCHGVQRFSCSLCSNKYSTAGQARTHFKTRHNICQISLTPVNPDKTNIDMDEYMVRPKSVLQPLAAGDATPNDPSAATAAIENVYTPDQIDKIPMRHILSCSIRCGLCSYSTKVRTNMVRHLQFHLEEKAVSESAPVNPVPCLEKNEKMFDKMVNLASSSHTGSRMGGAKSEGKDKEADNLPDFVQTHCRYVCPAHGCNYLCPEEANLRHHIMALHDNETSFTCVHCKADLSHTEAENIIKHFKLHGLQLYKCQYCNFVSNLRHKVEKHTVDAHPDLPFNVVTVRCLESEPKDQEPSASTEQDAPPPPAPSKPHKPWRCCMCKYKSGTQQGIQHHVLEKHDINAQIKCALCTYKDDDHESFAEHFREAHNNQTVDVIYAYRKMEDKEKESEASFDTTPLWQRDRPRVRHIRGILFDESSPVVKSPKKAAKSVVSSPGPSGVASSASPAPKTSLDISIESVANGTADILQAALASSFAPGDFAPEGAKDGDEDDVIIIDDDDDRQPLAKNKDNKNAPVAKNRPAKRKGVAAAAEVVATGVAKLPKLADEVIDLDGNASDGEQDEFSERSLRLRYGNFGTPLNRQLKCPVCNQFKSKRISDFIFHLFKEMKVYRFKCKICSDESITFRYMYKHVQEHNASIDCDENIAFLPPDRKLEAWLQMVVREQSLIILQNFSPTPDSNVSASGGKLIACRHCRRQYQSEQERNEHSIIHWSLKPFGCSKCKFTSYNAKEVAKHLETHANPARLLANLSQNVVSKAPTVAEELKLSDDAHMKEMRGSAAAAAGVQEIEEEDPLRLPESGGVEKAVENAAPFGMGNGAPFGVGNAAPLDLDIVAPPKDEDAELSENDLFIVTKTDSNVPLETDVYCCEYCPYMTNSETLVISHITSVHEHMHIKFKMLNRITCEQNERDYVGCMLCPEMGSEIRVRQHHLEKHDGQTFLLYRYTCSLCHKRFLKTTGLKMHFKKLHTGFPLKYVGLKGEEAGKEEHAPSPAAPTRASPKPQNLRCYKCPLCSYERLFQPNSVSNVRSHLKQHFKAFTCGVCVSLKFKTRWEAMSHFLKEHRGQPENIVQDAKVNDEYNEMMARIVRDSKPADEKPAPPPAPTKNTARKSTSAPSRRAAVEEYSYYGRRPEPVDLAKIMTAVEVNGMSLSMTAEKLSKIFDLQANVVVEDCNLSVNLSALFDS